MHSQFYHGVRFLWKLFLFAETASVKLQECLGTLPEKYVSKTEEPMFSVSTAITGPAAIRFRDELQEPRATIQRQIDALDKERAGKTGTAKQRKTQEIKKLKAELDSLTSDADMSCTKWTVDLFSEYFSDGYPLSYESEPVGTQDWRSIRNTYRQQARLMDLPEEPEAFMQNLSLRNYPEVNVTYFVMDILKPLLLRKNMHPSLQETINIDGLPTCKYDIAISDAERVPVGIIETKAPAKLIQNSVVQCMLQLVAIHALHGRYDLFGIVTDGGKFVFITLTRCGAFLVDVEGSTELKVHTWKTLDELRNICSIINGLLNVVQRQKQDEQETSDQRAQTSEPESEEQ